MSTVSYLKSPFFSRPRRRWITSPARSSSAIMSSNMLPISARFLLPFASSNFPAWAFDRIAVSGWVSSWASPPESRPASTPASGGRFPDAAYRLPLRIFAQGCVGKCARHRSRFAIVAEDRLRASGDPAVFVAIVSDAKFDFERGRAGNRRLSAALAVRKSAG